MALARRPLLLLLLAGAAAASGLTPAVAQDNAPASPDPTPRTPPRRTQRPARRRTARPAEPLPEPPEPAPPPPRLSDRAPVPNRDIEPPRRSERDAPSISPSFIQPRGGTRGGTFEGDQFQRRQDRLFDEPAPGATLRVPFGY